VNVTANFVDRAVPLGDGYRVASRIVVWEGRNVVKVPLSALFHCQQNWCAFVVDKDRARKRQVEISHRNNLSAAISKGLTAGEAALLHCNEAIQEGILVTAR